jgi:hypothetical protein
LRAVHHVSVEVPLKDGKHDHRALRAAIAVERPDKLRLRALGPGGITLFDLLVVGGQTKVLSAIAETKTGAFGEVVRSMAGDLSAAYGLSPAPTGRTTTLETDAVVVSEPDRTVRLSRFRRMGNAATFTHAEVSHQAPAYSVSVEVSEVELDPVLDPGLFAE